MDPKDDDKIELDEESLDEQIQKEEESKEEPTESVVEGNITEEEKATINDDQPIDIKDEEDPKPSKKVGGKKFITALLVFLALIGVLFIGLVIKEIISPTEEEEQTEEEVVETVNITVSDMATAYYVVDSAAVFDANEFATDTLQIFVTGNIQTEEIGEEVTVAWYLENEGRVITEVVELTDESSSLVAGANMPEGGWPVGEHYVVVEYEDEELGRTDFLVVVDSELTTKHFYTNEFGVYFQYPNHWKYEMLTENSIIFSGAEGTVEYDTTVYLQNILTETAGGEYESIVALYEDYEEQITAAGGTITDQETDVFESIGQEYNFIRFTAQYEQEDVEFQQYTVLIERDENYIQQLDYTAPIDLFDQYLENFNLVMEHFEIVK